MDIARFRCHISPASMSMGTVEVCVLLARSRQDGLCIDFYTPDALDVLLPQIYIFQRGEVS